jgi:hypothetical protein
MVFHFLRPFPTVYLVCGSFRAFGPLRYARITLDRATGRSRGTGFACFWNKDDADKVIQQSELLRSETTGSDTVRISAFYPWSCPILPLLSPVKTPSQRPLY